MTELVTILTRLDRDRVEPLSAGARPAVPLERGLRLDPGRAARPDAAGGRRRRHEHQTARSRTAGASWSDLQDVRSSSRCCSGPRAARPVEQLSLVCGLAVAEAIEATATRPDDQVAERRPRPRRQGRGDPARVSGATRDLRDRRSTSTRPSRSSRRRRDSPAPPLRVATGRAHDRPRCSSRSLRRSSGATTPGASRARAAAARARAPRCASRPTG